MKRVHITLSRTAIALVVALGATTPTLAAVCNNVIFRFTNTTEGPIRVDEVGYRDLDSANPGQLRTEEVRRNPTRCASGATCDIPEQDLGSITRPREQHELTDVQVRYQEMDDLGRWQDLEWSDANVPADMTCRDDRTYGPYAIVDDD